MANCLPNNYSNLRQGTRTSDRCHPGKGGMTRRKKLICDTCGREVEYLRRDVVDVGYNALTKPPLWNCEECYQKKRAQRLTQSCQEHRC